MNLSKLLLINNECFKANIRHTVKGIMVHSTGANNPALKRYVGPDDGLLGVNPYNNHWNMPRPGGKQVCVHAFIGKLKDGSVATYQTLPWDIRGWHSGIGSKGSANTQGYIGFEICEDGLSDPVYFNAVYREAVELCAMLCRQYSLNPATAIICHNEGYKSGIASNHADVMHWFPRHGKSMETFRADIALLLDGKLEQPSPQRTYTVKEGDSLWSIAAKSVSEGGLGNGARYPVIAKLNGIVGGMIHPGKVLKLP